MHFVHCKYRSTGKVVYSISLMGFETVRCFKATYLNEIHKLTFYSGTVEFNVSLFLEDGQGSPSIECFWFVSAEKV